MTQYLSKGSPFPTDGKHHWIYILHNHGRTLEWAKKALGPLGIHVGGMTDQPPDRTKEGYSAYAIAGKATSPGVTVNDLARALDTPATLVNPMPVAAFLESRFENADSPTANMVFVPASNDDYLSPNGWYIAVLGWAKNSVVLPNSDYEARLKGVGLSAYFPTGILPPTTDYPTQVVFIGTGGARPQVRVIREALKTDVFIVSRVGLQANITALKDAEEYLKKWTSLGKNIQKTASDVASSFAEVADGLGSFTAGLNKALALILKLAVPAVVVFLGWNVYKYVRDQRGGRSK